MTHIIIGILYLTLTYIAGKVFIVENDHLILLLNGLSFYISSAVTQKYSRYNYLKGTFALSQFVKSYCFYFLLSGLFYLTLGKWIFIPLYLLIISVLIDLIMFLYYRLNVMIKGKNNE